MYINKNWWIPFLETQKGFHEAVSKDAFFVGNGLMSVVAGCSISHNLNLFSSNSKKICHVNKFTSAFLQNQNYKVKQSQK